MRCGKDLEFPDRAIEPESVAAPLTVTSEREHRKRRRRGWQRASSCWRPGIPHARANRGAAPPLSTLRSAGEEAGVRPEGAADDRAPRCPERDPALLALALIVEPAAPVQGRSRHQRLRRRRAAAGGADEPPDHGLDVIERDASLGRAQERIRDRLLLHGREVEVRTSSPSPAADQLHPHAVVAQLNFSWVVRAVDTNGRPSAESNTVTYRTPPDATAPSAPTLSPLYVGPELVELDWTDSVDDVSKVSYAVNVNGTRRRRPSHRAVARWRRRPRTRSA